MEREDARETVLAGVETVWMEPGDIPAATEGGRECEWEGDEVGATQMEEVDWSYLDFVGAGELVLDAFQGL